MMSLWIAGIGSMVCGCIIFWYFWSQSDCLSWEYPLSIICLIFMGGAMIYSGWDILPFELLIELNIFE